MFTSNSIKNTPLLAVSVLFGIFSFVSLMQINNDQLQTHLPNLISILVSIVALSFVLTISFYNIVNIMTNQNKQESI